MSVTEVDAGPHIVARATDVHAPAAELFDILADPRRHGELDGSGTVGSTTKGPDRLSKDAKFSVNMKQYGLPYRITSKVTDFEAARVLEWRHPMGHRWRWELTPLSPDSTHVVESFDYTRVPGIQAKFYEVTGQAKRNATGIEATLTRLGERYPR
jgi:hypothetical protein